MDGIEPPPGPDGGEAPEFILCQRKLDTANCMRAELRVQEAAAGAPPAAASRWKQNALRFSDRQRGLQSAGLFSNQRKGDAQYADIVQRQHDSALQEVLSHARGSEGLPVTLDWLRHVHQILVRNLLPPEKCGALRRGGAHIGDRIEFPPSGQVRELLQTYCAQLRTLIDRTDVSAHAKAGWAAYHFVVIHPFEDGNGRMCRLLANWALARSGVPFPVCLCGSQEHRKAYSSAIDASNAQRSSAPMAGVVGMALHRAWLEFDRFQEGEAESAQAALVREWRATTKRGSCGICLAEEPDISTLCCGGAFHNSCLLRWLITPGSQSCPCCREELPQPELPASARGFPCPDDTTAEDTTTASILGASDEDTQAAEAWTCERCTLVNEPHLSHCLACELMRPDLAAQFLRMSPHHSAHDHPAYGPPSPPRHRHPAYAPPSMRTFDQWSSPTRAVHAFRMSHPSPGATPPWRQGGDPLDDDTSVSSRGGAPMWLTGTSNAGHTPPPSPARRNPFLPRRSSSPWEGYYHAPPQPEQSPRTPRMGEQPCRRCHSNTAAISCANMCCGRCCRDLQRERNAGPPRAGHGHFARCTHPRHVLGVAPRVRSSAAAQGDFAAGRGTI